MKFFSTRSRKVREKFSTLEQGGVLRYKYIIKCLFIFLQSVCTEYSPSQDAKQMSDSKNCSQELMQKGNRLKTFASSPGAEKAVVPRKWEARGEGVQVADIIPPRIKQKWLPNWITFCWQRDIVQKWVVPPFWPCSRWHSVRWTSTNINVKSGTDTSCNFHLSRHLWREFWQCFLTLLKMRWFLFS